MMQADGANNNNDDNDNNINNDNNNKEESILAHAMVISGGALHFITRKHCDGQKLLGRTLCRGCGFFFGDGGPIRTHAQNSRDSRCLDIAAGEYYEKPCRDASAPSAPSEPSEAQASPAPQAPVQTRPDNLDPGIRAARDGDLDELKRLVQGGRWHPLTAADHHGNGPLHWAAGSGHVAVCRWLVEEAGVDPSRQNSQHHGRTALHWAARNGHLQVCQWLLELLKSDDVDVQTDGGDTALMLASWQGHLKVVEFLVAASADVNHLNSWGCNAMHKAARMDGAASSRETIEFLHKKGVDPCQVNCNGHNALHKAAQYGSVTAVRWLLEEGGCRSRAAIAPDRDRNSPSALAYAAGFRALASEIRHVEDTLWLAPALYYPGLLQEVREEPPSS
ncbi:unnamed protein product [Polarella glacialis]|uniref:Uncharacterized protein n=1 Tax=Polarella glacialis TaxID=89957 RepID=A0A813FNY0_POLGL|nr:unnamed protein product [Polarella glacialis]